MIFAFAPVVLAGWLVGVGTVATDETPYEEAYVAAFEEGEDLSTYDTEYSARVALVDVVTPED